MMTELQKSKELYLLYPFPQLLLELGKVAISFCLHTVHEVLCHVSVASGTGNPKCKYKGMHKQVNEQSINSLSIKIGSL